MGVTRGVYPCQEHWKAIYAFLCPINHLPPYLKTWSRNARPELRHGHLPSATSSRSRLPSRYQPPATVCWVIHHARLNQQGVKRWLWGLLSEGSDHFIKEAGRWDGPRGWAVRAAFANSSHIFRAEAHLDSWALSGFEKVLSPRGTLLKGPSQLPSLSTAKWEPCPMEL